MHIAILTFDGYNELDSFIALGILNRAAKDDWKVSIASPDATVTSMNGAVLHSQATLAEASMADAVIVGSGIRTREVVGNAPSWMRALDNIRPYLNATTASAQLLLR